jgi:NADH-quinone oxidoreductase subunit N
MDFVIPDFAPAAPEIFLLVMACVALVVDVYLPARLRLVTYQIAQAGLVGAAVLSIALYPAEPVTTFHGGYVNDGLGSVLKAFALLVAYFALFYTRIYLEARDALRGEYFVLALFAVLGMMVLISAGSLLTVYLGLELLALSLYAMVALQRDSLVASEAAMKYFVLGALASGMLLYGISIVYGLTGTIEIAGVREAIAAGGGSWTWPSSSPWCSWWWVSPSSSVRCRSTCGCRMSTRVPRPRSPCSSAPPRRSPPSGCSSASSSTGSASSMRTGVTC